MYKRQAEIPSSTPIKAEDEQSEIFTLKQLNHRKRKSDQMSQAHSNPAATDGLASQASEITIEDSMAEAAEAQRAAEKAARKAARKAAKQAKRAADEDEDGVKGEPEEPFDYASAPNVLNAGGDQRRDGRRDRKDRNAGGKGGEFNPYAKALDTPKGLPRAQKERAGKSMTFRS